LISVLRISLRWKKESSTDSILILKEVLKEAIVSPASFSTDSIRVNLLAKTKGCPRLTPSYGRSKISTLFYKRIMGIEEFDEKDTALIVNYYITDYGKSFLFDK